MDSLNRLEGFYWVARAQGYARAVRVFPYPITQPGLHQQVRKLEQELEVRLFERAGKDRVLLTPAGQRLFAAVAPFLEHLPAVVEEVTGRKLGGRLRVSAPGHIMRHLLPGWLRRVERARPDILFELHESGRADLGPLRGGETDVLVDYLPEIPADICTQTVGEVVAAVALPTGHAAARRRRVRLRDLGELPFVAYEPGRAHRTLQLQALTVAGISPRILAEAGSSDTLVALVAAGLGFSLIPVLAGSRPSFPGVTLRPLLEPRAHFPISAAWRRSSTANPVLRAALQLAPRGTARSHRVR
jgi:DNA-binding transcriptional LysR family regulator